MKPKRAKEHFILLLFSFFLLLRTFDNIEYLPSHPPMLERMLVLEYE